MKSRRKFSKEFKQTAVNRLNSGQTAAEVARALEVHPSDLHRWRRELQEHGDHRARGTAHPHLRDLVDISRGYQGPPKFLNSTQARIKMENDRDRPAVRLESSGSSHFRDLLA